MGARLWHALQLPWRIDRKTVSSRSVLYLKETLGAARPLCVNLASGLHILMSHSTEPHFPTYFATQTLNAQLPGSFVPSHLHRGCKLLLLLRSHVVGEPQSTFLLEASCS